MLIVGIVTAIMLLMMIRLFLGQYLRCERRNARNHQAPYVNSYPRHLSLMKKKLFLEAQKNLVDLGCGDGRVLRFFAQQYRLNQIDGYDNNRVAIRWGKFLNRITHTHQVSLMEADFTQISIDQYDYIYLFLLPPQLDSIQKRLQKNMKSDAIIICNTFAFSHRKSYQEIVSDDGKTKVRLYRKES